MAEKSDPQILIKALLHIGFLILNSHNYSLNHVIPSVGVTILLLQVILDLMTQ